MNTITAPKPITTELRRLSPDVDRECFLVRKRGNVGLTFAEDVELKKLQRQADLRQQALDAVAEANAEGRIPHYHELSVARNIHE